MEVPFQARLDSDHWSAERLFPLSDGFRSEVVFAHYGSLGPEVKESLIHRMEEMSVAAADALSLRKRLFNALCEGLDNLAMHTEPAMRDTCFAVLLRGDGAYRLFLGNHVPATTAQMLLHRCDVLTGMSEVDLRECFLKLLANDGRTERGGAGLGLLTMARKSSLMRAHTSIVSASTSEMIIELWFEPQ